MRGSEKQSQMLYSPTSANVCPVCGGSGTILSYRSTAHSREVYGDDRQLIFADDCPNCRSKADRNAAVYKERSNIPPAFYQSKYSDFNWAGYKVAEGEAIDLSQQKAYIDSFINEYKKWEAKGIGLYIYSRMRGSGKTFLASAICNELMSRYSIQTKFVSESVMLDLSEQDNRDKTNNIDTLCKCKVLCIDDLGATKASGTNKSDWLNDLLFKIIDYRYQHSLVTLVTSNVRMNELHLDNRIVSRVTSLTQNLPLPEYSFRQSNANKDKIDFFKDLGLMGENNDGNT